MLAEKKTENKAFLYYKTLRKFPTYRCSTVSRLLLTLLIFIFIYTTAKSLM